MRMQEGDHARTHVTVARGRREVCGERARAVGSCRSYVDQSVSGVVSEAGGNVGDYGDEIGPDCGPSTRVW